MSKNPPKPKTSLSKSLFIKGMQCKKALWLRKYKKEVLTPPDNQTLAIFETGNRVGELACKLFENGKKIPYENCSFQDKIDLTKRYMDKEVDSIYEATFEYNGILVMVDILNKTKDGWAINEVKSSTWNKTKTKNDITLYILDAAIQYYVLNGLGIKITDTNLILINSEYVRGDELDLNELFSIVSVDEEVEFWQDEIPIYLAEFQKVLKDSKNEPDIDIGQHCKISYECEARKYCWRVQKEIPKFSVFDIFTMTKNAKSLQLYHDGIVKIEDIPDDFALTQKQSLVVNAWKEDKKYINKEEIEAFLDKISYPIYHLDFETMSEAIPSYKGTRPYEQIPFQYSLHIEYSDGSLKHREFLANESKDPREQIVKKIIKDIPTNATIMAYNASFEKRVLNDLANSFPKYKKHLLFLTENFIDLAKPFQQRSYYLPQMRGKYSIKIVLPLLVPDMEQAYKELSLVNNGSDAMNTFPKLKQMPKKQKDAYRKALLEYCKLDTLAMMKVLGVLREVV